jgi:pimeloyl-ACP methyl ester carboxylesterase
MQVRTSSDPPPPAKKTALLSFEEVDLFVAEAGSGPPLVWIHGYTLNHELWTEQVLNFSREFRCIAYDLRGHGGSSSPGTGYGIQDHTRDFLQILDALEVPSASVVGLSMGAGIALSAGLNHPERVDRLILASGTLGGLPWEESMWNYFREFESEARRAGVQVAVDAVWMKGPLFNSVRRYPALMARLRRMADRFSGSNIFDRASYGRPAVPDSQRLGEVRCPTLVLRGENEIPEFVRRADILASEIPAARLEVVSGAGHFLNLESPVVFNRIVREFLQENAGGGPAQPSTSSPEDQGESP